VVVPEERFTLYQGDARNLEQLVEPLRSDGGPLLTCTITSPPYFDLKNYGHPDQIGWGQSYDDYRAELRSIFRMLHRNTADEGSLWLVADTLRLDEERRGAVWRLEPLPFHLAEEAAAAGWTLRDIIIWRKDKTLPWSSRGRLRNTFEYVLLLVKSQKFKYRVDRLRDPVRLERWWVQYPERYNPQGKAPTNVWDLAIPVQGSWGSTSIDHVCPLPPDLVERLIELSTDPGDVVFDPFAGSGVVVAEAIRLGRRGLGIELDARQVRKFKSVVRQEIAKRKTDTSEELARQSRWLEKRIVELRVIKYPRVLVQQLRRKYPELPAPELILVHAKKPDPSVLKDTHKFIDADMTFIVDDAVDAERHDEILRALKTLGAEAPCSKFGVEASFHVSARAGASVPAAPKRWYVYRDGRTYWYTESVASSAAMTVLPAAADRYPPIIGNLRLREEPRPLGTTTIGKS
jgi:DNA modification methylase